MIAAGVVAAGVVLFFFSRRAGAAVTDAASAVGTAINPTDPGNLVSRGVNAVGDAIDNAEDDDSFSLGGFIFDLFHPEFDPNAPITSEDERVQTMISREFLL